jgi:uncharacterized protein YciI
MPWFAVMCFDHPSHSMKRRDVLRAEHRRYVLENDASIKMTGAMTDGKGNQCGSLYIFATDDAEDIWGWLRREPFYAGGVYETVRIAEWSPALNRIDPVDWPAQAAGKETISR